MTGGLLAFRGKKNIFYIHSWYKDSFQKCCFWWHNFNMYLGCRNWYDKISNETRDVDDVINVIRTGIKRIRNVKGN